MWWPPVASSTESSTLPFSRIDTPVVPWPMSMTQPSVMPRALAAATGSSTTSSVSSPAAVATLRKTLVSPSLMPGGIDTDAEVKRCPVRRSRSSLSRRTAVVAPAQSTTTPSRTTVECTQAPATGRSSSSTTDKTMFAVPRSTPSRGLPRAGSTSPVRTSSAKRRIAASGAISAGAMVAVTP